MRYKVVFPNFENGAIVDAPCGDFETIVLEAVRMGAGDAWHCDEMQSEMIEHEPFEDRQIDSITLREQIEFAAQRGFLYDGGELFIDVDNAWYEPMPPNTRTGYIEANSDIRLEHYRGGRR